MKVALDEHIPPTVAEAVKILMSGNKRGRIEIVMAKDYADPPAESDTPWLRNYARDGGVLLITADKKMRAKLHERQALIELNLIAFFVPTMWHRTRFNDQTAYILRWWDTIIKCAKRSKRGSCWQLPSAWTVDINKIKDVTGPTK